MASLLPLLLCTTAVLAADTPAAPKAAEPKAEALLQALGPGWSAEGPEVLFFLGPWEALREALGAFPVEVLEVSRGTPSLEALFLHLFGEHLLATGVDARRAAAEQRDRAVVLDPGIVAGDRVPAPGDRSEGGRGLLGILVVAERHDAAHRDATDLAGAGRNRPAFVVDHECILAELESRAGDAKIKEHELDLRYEGQQWPVRVAIGGTFDPAAARKTFEAEHQRLYGHIQPGGRIDITALRVIGRTPLDWTPPAARSPQQGAPKPKERRKVWIDPATGWRDVPVYDGADLRPGCVLTGPLLVEEKTTTAFIGPRDRLEVDARDDFLVHIGGAA